MFLSSTFYLSFRLRWRFLMLLFNFGLVGRDARFDWLRFNDETLGLLAFDRLQIRDPEKEVLTGIVFFSFLGPSWESLETRKPISTFSKLGALGSKWLNSSVSSSLRLKNTRSEWAAAWELGVRVGQGCTHQFLSRYLSQTTLSLGEWLPGISGLGFALFC